MSTIKDVIQLSHKHNIENKLYNSDVLDKIYKINGEGRVIKFFVKLYDEKLEKEALWKRLTALFEKDFNIQKQNITSNDNTSQENQDSKTQ